MKWLYNVNYWLIALFLFAGWRGYSQTREAYIQETTERMTTKVQFWTVEDGLPSPSQYGFFEDSRGIVWLQSSANLCYYDGTKIVRVEEGSERLYRFYSASFAEDLHGNIWRYIPSEQHTANGALTIYNPSRRRFYTLQEYYLEWPHTLPLSADLLVFSLRQKVYIFDYASEKLWCYDGALRIVYEAHGVSPPEAEHSKVYLPGPSGYFWHIDGSRVKLTDARGQLEAEYPSVSEYWLSENGQLWALDRFSRHIPFDIPQRIKKEMRPNGDLIIPQVQISNGRRAHSLSGISTRAGTVLWYQLSPIGELIVATDGEQKTSGLIDSIEQAMPGLRTSPYLVHQPSILTLRDGSMLIKVEEGFLHLTRKRNYFTTYLPNERIRSITAVDTATLASTTVSGARKESLKALHLPTGSSQTRVRAKLNSSFPYSVFNKRGFIWVGFANGDLEQYNQQWQMTEHYGDFPSALYQEAKSLQYITDSTLWYATNNGLIEVDVKADSSYYIWEGQRVNYIHRDHSGEYWLGTDRGLYHLSSGQYFLEDLYDDGFSISHIYEDEQGVFWLSTQRGLIRWRPYEDAYEQYTTAEGLSNNIIHAAYPDQSGHLWLSSNHGIMSFDTVSKRVNIYTVVDGLACNEQNFNAHYAAADGRLYFGGQEGLTAFYPDQLLAEERSFYYPIQFNAIQFLDKSGDVFDTLSLFNMQKEVIDLPRGTHQAYLNFFFPAYLSSTFKLEWQLQDSEAWQKVDQNYTLFLSGLPYGHFDVNLRATSNTDSYRILRHKVSFYKPYPIYYTLWFWLLVLLFNILLIFALIRYRERRLTQLNSWLTQNVAAKTQELEVEKKKLEELDAAKTRLFRSFSHELRTPLSIISAVAQQQLDDQHGVVQSDMSLIRQEAQHLDKMITDILNLSNLEAGKIGVKPKTVEWNGFISQVFGQFQALAQQKHLNYQLKLSREEEVYVRLDTDKLEQILHILITNAIKFTPAGGTVYVQGHIGDGYMELIVADNGIGIPEEEQQAIFDRYYQGKEVSKGHNQYGGFGIGLATCKEYAALMDGQLSVNSTLGEGAAFSLRLPLVLATASDIADLRPDKTIQKAPSLSSLLQAEQARPRLLVIEDNDPLRDQLERLLSKQYEVDTAANGKEAFERLEASVDYYDVIISDIMMPLVDGFSLLQKVREHPELRLTPFLFLTALIADEERLKALRLGVDAFLTKPFQKEELFAQIRNLLRRQQVRKQSLKDKSLTHKQEPILTGQAGAEDNFDVKETYDEAWLRQLDEVVRENLPRLDFKVSEMAEKLYVSERTLRNYVNDYTGMTPSAYLQKARLDQAMIWIQSRKHKTVGEVAFAVGFKDARYFSKIFKREFGESPSSLLE